MANSFKKRGQKLMRRWSRASQKAGEESREHIKENFIERVAHIQNIRLLIFEWVLLVSALLMLAVAQAFWFSDSYARETFVNGGTYIEATVGRVNSLNPLFATTTSEKVLSRLLFATIATTDFSGHPGNGLAQSIRSSEDGKIWTVKLREGLKWSNGEPLTNADVLFTVGLIQNPAVNSIYSANLENVQVSENAAGEIVFALPAAYADFISALEIPVLPQSVLADVPAKTLVEADFSNNPVGSGPFSFNALQSASGSDEAVFYLSANSEYHAGTPMLSSFAVHTYADKDAVADAVNAGAVTATAELSGLDTEKIINGGFEQKDSPLSAGVFMFFNLSNGALANRDLRVAIRQGLDAATVRAAAPGTEALDYPILTSQINLKDYPALPGYDAAAAREKIAALAHDLNLNIVTVNSGYLPAVAEAVAEQLRELGIESTVTAYAESQDFVTSVISRRNYDVLIYEIELGADPDLLPYYHSSQTVAGGLNLSNYRNALVDDLLIGARETLDAELRARKYESFLDYWVTDAPAIGLYRPNLTYIYNKNVRPYEDLRLVTALDRFVDVGEWAVSRGSKSKTP